MKVLHVSPNLGVGGAEVLLNDLVAEQSDAGHDVQVVSLWPRSGTFVERALERRLGAVTYLNKAPGADLRVPRRMWSLLRQQRPEVIHTHRDAFRYTVPAARLLRLPIVHTVHNTPQRDCSTSADRVLRRIAFLREWATPVALTSTLAADTAAFYDLPGCEYVHNGVPVAEALQVTRESRTTRWAFVGRLVDDKDPIMALRVMALVKDLNDDITLDIYGDGPMRRSVVAQAAELGIARNIRVLGVVSNLRERLSDYGLLLSTSRVEGMPLCMMEAMAAGVPVVAPRVGGVAALLSDEYEGLVTRRDDPKAYVNAAKAVLCDRLARSRMIASNHDRVASMFSTAQMRKEYDRVYRLVLKQ